MIFHDIESFNVYGRHSDVEAGENTTYQKIIYISSTGSISGEKPEVCKGGGTTIGIKYFSDCGRTIMDISSAPSLVYGTSLVPLGFDHIPVFIENLHRAISPFTSIDFSSATVSRLDSSTVFDMDRPVGLYIGLLNAMSPNSQFRMDKKQYDAETIQYFNGAQSVGFYDKVAQGKVKGFVPELMEEKNLLRYEIQSKRKRKVKDIYGDIGLKDVQGGGVVEKMVKERKKAFKRLFKYNSELAMDYERTINAVMKYREEGKRNAFEHLCVAFALNNGLDIQRVIDGYKAAGVPRSTIRRMRQRARELKMGWTNYSTDLYSELESKIDRERIE